MGDVADSRWSSEDGDHLHVRKTGNPQQYFNVGLHVGYGLMLGEGPARCWKHGCFCAAVSRLFLDFRLSYENNRAVVWVYLSID